MDNMEIAEVVKAHQDADIETFTTNLAALFGESESDNIAGALVGVAYKDGTSKTISYIANDQHSVVIFEAILGAMKSSIRKLIDTLAD